MRRCLCLVVLCAACLGASAAADSSPPVFEKDVLPVFQAKCLRCHGARSARPTSTCATRRRSSAAARAGRPCRRGRPRKASCGSRSPPTRCRPARPQAHRRREDAGPRLDRWAAPTTPASREPAMSRTSPFTDADRQFWAFRPPVRPAVPAVKQVAPRAQPHRRLPPGEAGEERADASPGGRPPTLLRRVTFDLTGLPPTPRGDRRLPQGRLARTPTKRSSIACWPARTTANAGAGTGSTWPATPTPRASSTPTTSAPPPGATAITSSAPSTPTSPMTASSRSKSPATS